MFFYWAYGLEIQSELEFPEMHPYAVKMPDLEIKFGKVPAMLTGHEVIAKEKFFISPTEYLVHLPICSYYVKEGISVTIELKENADLPSVRLFLLTNAMAAVLHQRNKVALHAGAIQTDKGLVVICGESGAGKSTSISALQQKGYKIFVDDVLVLEKEEERVVGVAAYPTLKLWDDTIEKLALGVIPEEQKLRESEGLVHFLNNSPAEVIGIALSEYGEPVLVEGGVNFLRPLIEQRLIDTFYITRSRNSGDGNFLDCSLLDTNYELTDSESLEENDFEVWLPRKQQSR